MPCLGSHNDAITETTYLTFWQAVDILGHDARDKSRESEQEGLHVGDESATKLINTKIIMVVPKQICAIFHFEVRGGEM